MVYCGIIPWDRNNIFSFRDDFGLFQLAKTNDWGLVGLVKSSYQMKTRRIDNLHLIALGIINSNIARLDIKRKAKNQSIGLRETQ